MAIEDPATLAIVSLLLICCFFLSMLLVRWCWMMYVKPRHTYCAVCLHNTIRSSSDSLEPVTHRLGIQSDRVGGRGIQGLASLQLEGQPYSYTGDLDPLMDYREFEEPTALHQPPSTRNGRYVGAQIAPEITSAAAPHSNDPRGRFQLSQVRLLMSPARAGHRQTTTPISVTPGNARVKSRKTRKASSLPSYTNFGMVDTTDSDEALLARENVPLAQSGASLVRAGTFNQRTRNPVINTRNTDTNMGNQDLQLENFSAQNVRSISQTRRYVPASRHQNDRYPPVSLPKQDRMWSDPRKERRHGSPGRTATQAIIAKLNTASRIKDTAKVDRDVENPGDFLEVPKNTHSRPPSRPYRPGYSESDFTSEDEMSGYIPRPPSVLHLSLSPASNSPTLAREDRREDGKENGREANLPSTQSEASSQPKSLVWDDYISEPEFQPV